MCHVIGGVGMGPDLTGVVGRKAASVPGFNYTPALSSSGLTWTRANLDRWLTDPRALVPGTAMRVKVLNEDVYDAVTFGAFLTAQDPSATATEESTRWFNRVLNLVHQVAPMARIVLVRGPEHALADIRRVLAESAPGA